MTEINIGKIIANNTNKGVLNAGELEGDSKMEEKILQINKLVNEIAVEAMSKSGTYKEAYDKVWGLKNIDKEMKTSISNTITSYSDKEKPTI